MPRDTLARVPQAQACRRRHAGEQFGEEALDGGTARAAHQPPYRRPDTLATDTTILVAFGATETDAAIQKTGYRMSPPGAKGDPTQAAVWEMDVKSWVNGPTSENGPVKAGMVQVHGVAMGATRSLRRVEVSVDGGSTWHEARFVGPDLGRFAWRQFVLPIRLQPGQYLLASRAQDSQFNWQVETTASNAGGYLNSGWRSHAFPVTVA